MALGDRRLLLLSYHFPPSTATGALRWEKLAGAAAARGYGLDAVAVAPEALDQRDDARLQALPPGTTVAGVAHRETHWTDRLEESAAGLRRRRPKPAATAPSGRPAAPTRPGSIAPEDIRWSLAPRDLLRAWWSWKNRNRDRRWAEDAAARADALFRPGIHRAIVTCGPPHMVHVTGGDLARRRGVPHAMDLRDPWSLPRRQPEEFASPLNFAMAARSESRAVAGAALVIANTDPLREALRERYPDRAERIITVMNGFDEEVSPRAALARFTMAYAGALYLDRDPRLVFRAAGRVVAGLGLTPGQFGIEFLGTGNDFAGVPLRVMAEQEGIAPFLTIHPRKPRAEALAFLAGSTLLLNLPQDSPYAIPSKVFEYLAFPSWVLALAAPGTPTARVLEGVDVDVVAPGDVDAIAGALTRRVQAFFQGARPGPIAGRERLSRAAQATILFDALERTLVEPPA